MLMLSELITSWMRTSQVTLFVHSFTLPRMAEWLCSSMMPGAMCKPLPSITTAFAGALRPLPTAEIRPPTASRSAPGIVPWGPAVQIVALRTSTAAGWAGGAIRQASVFPIPAAVAHGAAFAPALGPLEGLVTVPVHPHLAHLAVLGEEIAVRHGEVRDLAGFQRAEPGVEPQEPGRHRGHGGQRVRVLQAARDGLRHVGAELLHVLEPVRRERERHAGLRQLGGIRGCRLPVPQLL